MHDHECVCGPWQCEADIVPPGIRCRELADLTCPDCCESILAHVTKADLKIMARLSDFDPLLAWRARNWFTGLLF